MSQTHVDIAWRYSISSPQLSFVEVMMGSWTLVDVLMWRCVVMEAGSTCHVVIKENYFKLVE